MGNAYNKSFSCVFPPFSAQRGGRMQQDTNPAYMCSTVQEMLSLFLSCCSYATASHVTSAYVPCNVTSPFPQIFSEFVGLDGSVRTEKRPGNIGKCQVSLPRCHTASVKTNLFPTLCETLDVFYHTEATERSPMD